MNHGSPGTTPGQSTKKEVSRPVMQLSEWLGAAGPDRLWFFMQHHPPEETSIGPGKRSLDLLPVD